MDQATPTLCAIAALSKNRVIGNHNRLPWHLPADLKHFKTLTTGHMIVMGRKTYESIGKPLPHRTNVILSRNTHYQATGCDVVTSLDEAIQQTQSKHHEKIFIIGGADIYQQLLPRVEELFLTIIHQEFEGDAFFPLLDEAEWQEVAREDHEADEQNPYRYSFIQLRRIK